MTILANPSGVTASRDSGGGASPPDSLIDVIRVIPDECYRSSSRRSASLVVRDLAVYAAATVGLCLTHAWWLTILLWVVAGLAVSGMFVLGHDAAHGSLFGSRRANGVIGRILMLPSLHLFDAWKLGHNHIHHRHTIKQGMDFVWHPLTPSEFAALPRRQRLRHRIEWSAFGAGLYYTRNIWLNRMVRLWKPPAKWARGIHRDRALVTAAVVVAASLLFFFGGAHRSHYLEGIWFVTKVLVVPFLLFCWVIGWTVYVHHIDPNIAWMRRTWTASRAQLTGTTVLRMPFGLNFFFHWIFVHVPHHVDVRIPCYHLSRATDAIKRAFPGVIVDRRMRLRDYIRTTRRCKLFDFDTGRWHTYRSALALAAA